MAAIPALLAYQAVTGAYGSYQTGRAARATAGANKFIAELKAKQAEETGQLQEARSRQKFKQLRGKQRAAMAAQGVRLDVGTPLDLQQETEDVSELDALTIRMNAAREAFGYRTQASQYGMEADIAKRQARVGMADALLSSGLRYFDYKGSK